MLAQNKQVEVKGALHDLATNFGQLKSNLAADFSEELAKLSPDEKLSHAQELTNMAQTQQALVDKLPKIKELYGKMNFEDEDIEAAEKSVNDLKGTIEASKTELAQMTKQLKEKNAQNKKAGILTDDQWENSMSWVLKN